MKKENKKNIEKDEKKTRSFKSKLLILLLLFALVFIYAKYIGTTGLQTREYSIVNENIPDSFDGFSILQFSDLELGSTYNINDLKKLVDTINNLAPEIVVFTGDLVSKHHKLSNKEKNLMIEYLSKIDPLIGKYSVRGDDDTSILYEEIMDGSGFKDLSNTYELIYYKGLTPIVIYGLDSLLSGSQDFESTFSYPSEDEDTTYMATYRILLAHEPDTALKIGNYNISLMLSGHSHNSEINIPYLRELYNIEGASTYFDKEYKVDNTRLYVSSGLGTSKLGMRLFSKPSISIFRLYTD